MKIQEIKYAKIKELQLLVVEKFNHMTGYFQFIIEATSMMNNPTVQNQIRQEKGGSFFKNLTIGQIFHIAEQEQLSNFQTAISHGIVTLYSMLEASVSDFAKSIFPYAEHLHNSPIAKKMTISFSDLEGFDTNSIYDHFYKEFEERVTAGTMYGYGRFDALLSPLNINTSTLEREHKDNLFELAQLRNIIVHQNGRADDRFIKYCPRFKVSKGEVVVLSKNKFLRYLDSAINFIGSILEATHNEYINPKST